jgi:hypothetical protein
VSLRVVLVVLAILVVALRLLLARQKRRAALVTAAARGWRCPDCGARRVVAQKGLALAPDGEGRSLQLKAIACRACTFRGLAVHRGDARPRGHRLDWQEHAAFTLAVDRCPAPADPACECAAHQRYGTCTEATFDLD